MSEENQNNLENRLNNLENLIIFLFFAFFFIILMLRPVQYLTAILKGNYYLINIILFEFFWLLSSIYILKLSYSVTKRFIITLNPVLQKIIRCFISPLFQKIQFQYLILFIIGVYIASFLSGISLKETFGLALIGALPLLFKSIFEKKR